MAHMALQHGTALKYCGDRKHTDNTISDWIAFHYLFRPLQITARVLSFWRARYGRGEERGESEWQSWKGMVEEDLKRLLKGIGLGMRLLAWRPCYMIRAGIGVAGSRTGMLCKFGRA